MVDKLISSRQPRPAKQFHLANLVHVCFILVNPNRLNSRLRRHNPNEPPISNLRNNNHPHHDNLIRILLELNLENNLFNAITFNLKHIKLA
jgi:hypothetical protein